MNAELEATSTRISGCIAEFEISFNKYLHLWRLFGKKYNNGFSGNGLQQAPAVRRYLTELIIGITPALGLSSFRPERILENKPLSEDGLV